MLKDQSSYSMIITIFLDIEYLVHITTDIILFFFFHNYWFVTCIYRVDLIFKVF